MRCKRCGCTTDHACAGGCAWALPDLCSACLTEDEHRLAVQYAERLDTLRAGILADRQEARLLAILTGLAANPQANIHDADDFVGLAMLLAQSVARVAAVDDV